MSKLLKILLLCVLLLCAVDMSVAHAGAIDKLNRFLDSTQALRANFTQIVRSKNGKKPQTASGVMLFSRPGKFRWQIDRPYSQLLVGDGKEVWIFDPDLRQVTVKAMDQAIGSTPAALLVSKEAISKNFTLRELTARDGLEWVEALPKSPDSGFEKINLGLSGNELKAMELFDNFGQTTELNFSRIERNTNPPASLFSFTPPPGVDVIRE